MNDSSGNVDGTALLRGRWPAELRGRFYRNGPALVERAGERYHHWFDGDGMVQQFSIGAGRVSHRGRLVRTAKLKAEQQAGRFLMSALGTRIEGGPPSGGPDSHNVANTNAIEHAGQVLALWEGGSAYALHPADLSTRGPVTWRSDLQQVPFSAHPKVDSGGNLWNFGTSGVLTYVGAPDAWFLDRAAVSLMSAQPQEPGTVQLRTVQLNMKSGRVQQEVLPGEVEFPRMHPQRIGMPSRWLVTGTSWKPYANRAAGLLHGVQMVDVQTGRQRRFDYGPHLVAEEHIVVPKPGKTGELNAWLLGTTFDARRQSTVLNLLDAAHVEDGPVAQAVLPYLLPLGFHGNFTAA